MHVFSMTGVVLSVCFMDIGGYLQNVASPSSFQKQFFLSVAPAFLNDLAADLTVIF